MATLPAKETSELTVRPNADEVKNNKVRVTIEGSNLFTYIGCTFIVEMSASRKSREVLECHSAGSEPLELLPC